MAWSKRDFRSWLLCSERENTWRAYTYAINRSATSCADSQFGPQLTGLTAVNCSQYCQKVSAYRSSSEARYARPNVNVQPNRASSQMNLISLPGATLASVQWLSAPSGFSWTGTGSP